MKTLLILGLIAGAAFLAWSQFGPAQGSMDTSKTVADPQGLINTALSVGPLNAQVGCARHVYHLDGVDDCTLAVSVLDRIMLVEGTTLVPPDQGLCEGSKRSVIAGRMENGKFVASSLTLR